jgi:hypothetical protein
MDGGAPAPISPCPRPLANSCRGRLNVSDGFNNIHIIKHINQCKP